MNRFPIDRDGPLCHYGHASTETTNCVDCGRVVCPEHRSDCERCNRACCLRCASKRGFENSLCERCHDEPAVPVRRTGMTGRYLIYTPVESARDEKRFDKAWRKFGTICRSLHRDGLTYDVRLNLAGDRPHVLITACGIAKARKHSAARASVLPPPMPMQRCRDRAVEVEWFLPENEGRRNTYTAYWRTRHTRYEELAGMAEDHLRAELDYWRELEALSGQREHFKPGRTDETAYADDEVRTHEVAA